MALIDLNALATPTFLLLDTAVWSHVMLGDEGELPQPLLSTIEQAAHEQRLLASAASVWELARQIECGMLQIHDLAALIAAQERPPGISVLPITTEVIVDAHTLPPQPTPRDTAIRFIAATARRRQGIVVTMDPALIALSDTGAISAYDARLEAVSHSNHSAPA